MANRHRQAARNSQTERMCQVCKGDGYLVRNDGPRYGFGPDPQHDYTVPCSNEQCMDGWVRWAAVDPLEVAHALRHRRLIPEVDIRYGEAMARALTDVPAPSAARAMPWQAAA